jgi:CRISPR-associated endonuclease/helicase Cas3
MGEDGAPGGSWFSQGKRGILAPFAVGTIDQALMAALNVKHGFVRAFGLAGKVVILDEVHSYDLFTGTLIDSLLEILSHLKCTVIILSATLTRERRASLTASTIASLEYPLITAKQGTGDVLEVGINNSTDSSIDVKITDEAASIEEAISRAEHGQQVLWIENTVDDAQRIYRVLSARATDLRISCGLLHSRFTKASRAKHEDLWVALYGKDGHGHRLGSGRILVGTQVLEQSLDIDSDFLVSRIAPADMLLQRMGRLWRHEQTPRPSSARREAWIIAPKLERALVNPIREFGSTGLVYAPYVLCRTLEVWQGIDILSIPSQIRSILEKTYTKRPENERMAYLLSQLEEKGNKLRQLALRGLARGGTTQPDESAQTRYSEIDSTEVILLRYLHLSPDKKWMRVGLLDGTEYSIPIAGKGLKKAQVREIISCLGEHTARVASHLAPSKMHYSEAQWLKDYLYLGNPDFEEGVPFRIGIVDDSGMVRLNNNGNGNLKYRISYSETLGYQAEKIAADIYTDGETD